MASEQHFLMGIDIGFGDVKASISHNGKKYKFKFPTAITRHQRSEIRGLENSQDVYIYKNGRYILGDDALYSPNVISTRNIEFLKDFTPLLTFKVLLELSKTIGLDIERIIKSPKKICLGLPLEYYFDEKDNIGESIKQFMVSFLSNGEQKTYNISFGHVDVRAQGQGVLNDYMIEKGYLKNIEPNILVVDIGFNTVDVLSVENGKTSSIGSYMLEGKGVCQITKELGIEVKQKTGVVHSEQKLKDILRIKTIKIQNETQYLVDVIDQVVGEYTDYIFREIKTRSGNTINHAEKIIFAGGGVYYIENYLKKQFKKGFVHIPEDPEYSNSRGYLKKLEVVNGL